VFLHLPLQPYPYHVYLASVTIPSGEASFFRQTLFYRKDTAIRRRTAEVEQTAREYLWKRRVFTVAVWDLAKRLLAAECYRHPIPPEPISPL
jgi:hypothetical protein